MPTTLSVDDSCTLICVATLSRLEKKERWETRGRKGKVVRSVVKQTRNRTEWRGARVVGRRTVKGCLLEVRVEADESGISENPAAIFNCSNRTALFCRSQR